MHADAAAEARETQAGPLSGHGATIRVYGASAPAVVSSARYASLTRYALRCDINGENAMTTKLDKPLRRELEIGDKLYTLTIDGHGLKLTEKGHRKGIERSWNEIIGDDKNASPPGG